MNEEDHRRRHALLHQALDELLADWLLHQPLGKLPSNTTITELLEWSHKQTVSPEPIPGYIHAQPKIQ